MCNCLGWLHCYNGHAVPLMETSYPSFEILRPLSALGLSLSSPPPLTVSLVTEDLSPLLWEVMMLLTPLCSG